MTIRAKLALSFLCIVAIVAAQAAIVTWQSHHLLNGLSQASQVAIDQAIRSANIRIAAIGLGTLLVALVMGTFLAVWIARLIGRLTKAAAAFADGDFSWRVEDCGKDGFGTLAAVFNQMADDLQQAKGDLGYANKTMDERVRVRATALEEAHERLRQTQFELVQREKMSTLGQLAAGMAHEVNTPTAAILNASVDTGEHLRELLAFAMRPDELSTETWKWLADMLEALFGQPAARSDIHVRGERRRLEKQLREAGYSDSRRMAEVIVAFRMTDLADDEDFLQRLAQSETLFVLEHALAVKVSADISEASARKIARIVRSLRFYAHDSRGELSDIDVNESIDNTLVIMQNRTKHTARVEKHFGEDLPSVECGADLLQVWTNILSNACDVIEESEKEGMGLIEITSRLCDGKVVVEISNEGEPIPEDVLGKMFDPFFTTKRVGKGTGLGLSICMGILQRYGGDIRARNESGRVTFEVSLPTATNCQEGSRHTEEALMGQVTSPQG